MIRFGSIWERMLYAGIDKKKKAILQRNPSPSSEEPDDPGRFLSLDRDRDWKSEEHHARSRRLETFGNVHRPGSVP